MCVQRKGVYIDRSSTHIYYLFPIGNENFFSSQSLHISLYLLNLGFPLTITKIVPFSIIFDHCENEIGRISFFPKGAASSSYFKYNNYIEDNKVVLE